MSGRLAVDGGTPVRTAPLPHWPHFDEEQIEAAAAALRSGYTNYTNGPQGRAFEEAFAERHGARHGLAVANGTVALELIAEALGIGPGDDVVVTPRSFIASVASIVRRGARPVFADVDPDSQAITAASIAAVLTPATKAIMPVHLGGWPADMPAINDLAAERGIAVVEDASQAHGATVEGRPVGSWGTVAAFSCCQDKIITTGGEGGVITTDDDALAERLWSLRDHGRDRAAAARDDHPPGYRWVYHSFGTNARMTEFQSALGLRQVGLLDEWLDTRRRNAAVLEAAAVEAPALRVAAPPEGIGHAYYKYYAFVRPERLRPGWDRDRVMLAVEAEGIPVYTGACPELYLEEAFPPALRPEERLPVARELGETSLMLMVHPTLSHTDMADAAEALLKVLDAATA
ncbi:MAG: DegT/DnrJ/EryC1/StrS family aminotransferase [Actinobacteria bacterium]|nr:DegT/DnrJ/EryC1/StrS family aminotransferase [Actinomycetota bacterium]